MLGVELRREAWEPVLTSALLPALAVIGTFTPTGGLSALIDEKANREHLRSVAEEKFADAVVTLNQFWRGSKGQSSPRQQPSFPMGKVGRSASCPCGSGRKFKRCCGAD